MKTTGNTILITGGSAGIGLSLAQKLITAGNTVIISGRNKSRLKEAAAALGGTSFIQADISNENDVNKLLAVVGSEYPELNILINNAGMVSNADIINDTNLYSLAETEIRTNYLSTIRMNEMFLPLLKKQPEAAIVHMSSITAFAPPLLIATYAASKAALHSYSQALRLGLANSTVKLFEVMPPLVNTEFSAPAGGSNGIPPSQVADEFFTALANDTFEVHVAGTKDLYELYLHSPAQALSAMNKLSSDD